MRTVKDVSRLAGISIRTLRYYDEIGLLIPTRVTEAGYRLYDKEALEKMQEIFSLTASSSWVRPLFLRSSRILIPRLMSISVSFPFVCKALRAYYIIGFRF